MRRSSIYGTEDRIVLQMGSKFLLIGFSNEMIPRAMVPAPETPEALVELFSTYLQCDPKTRKVILVESVDWSVKRKREVVSVLFSPRLQVQSISFINSDILALAATGKGTGLVLDIGHSGTSCVPVYDHRPLISQSEWCSIGGRSIENHTRDLLAEQQVDPAKLTKDVIEDVIVRYGYVYGKPEDPGVITTYSGYGVEFSFESEMCARIYDPLFIPDSDMKTIANRIVSCVRHCPIDIRRAISSNVVFVGGLSMVYGVRSRIVEQVNEELGLDFVPVPCAFKPNIAAWVGGSLFGAVRASSKFEILRANYSEDPRIPDWSILNVSCAESLEEERKLER